MDATWSRKRKRGLDDGSPPTTTRQEHDKKQQYDDHLHAKPRQKRRQEHGEKKERRHEKKIKPRIVRVRSSQNTLNKAGYYTFVNETATDVDHLKKLTEYLTEDLRRKIALDLSRSEGLVRHQIQSFEKFMDVHLPAIVRENRRTVVDSMAMKRRHVLELDNLVVYKPTHREADGTVHPIFAHECRIRNLAYMCSVVVDVRYTVFDVSGYTKETLPSVAPSTDLSCLRMCESRISRETLLCQIPCMLGSKYDHAYASGFPSYECPLDVGGSFVINGSDKFIVSQEKMRTNHPCIYPERAAAGKSSYICEIRSLRDDKMRSTSNMYAYMARDGGRVTVSMAFVMWDMPLIVAFALLRVPPERIVDRIVAFAPDTLRSKLTEFVDRLVVEDRRANADALALSYPDLCELAGKRGTKESTRDKRIKSIERVLASEFMPHIASDASPVALSRKADFMAYCIYRLCAVHLDLLPCDERDHYAQKRVDTPGVLLAMLFRPAYTQFVKFAAGLLRRYGDLGKAINVCDIINHRRLTNAVKYAMSTGNWGPSRGGSTATGVAQVHNRMTLTSMLSALRRVNTPINKEGKLPKVRQLRASHWRLMCLIETPEGSTCGLIKNLALGCRVRTGYDAAMIWETIVHHCADVHRLRLLPWLHDDCPIRTPSSRARSLDYAESVAESVAKSVQDDDETDEDEKRDADRDSIVVFINGDIVARAPAAHADDFVMQLREFRRCKMLPEDASIVYRPGVRTLHIHVDAGCCVSPLFAVARLHLLQDIVREYGGISAECLIDQLTMAGVVEWVSKDEEETLRVAVDPSDLVDPRYTYVGDSEPFTHLEISTALLVGCSASLIPFYPHNQAPRNMYQTAMQKQSKSMPCLNGEHRADAVSQTLCNPNVPLVQTVMEDALGATRLPMGQNVMLAVMSFTGYNQEDSVIVNQSALERGLFRYYVRRTYRDEEKSNCSDSTKFEYNIGRAAAEATAAVAASTGGQQQQAQPPVCRGLRTADYSKLGADGIAPPGTLLKPNDVLIGKVMYTEEVADPDQPRRPDEPSRTARSVRRDRSTILRSNESAVVERVIESKNRDDTRAVKVVTRVMRTPEIGDKLSSRHGQKGTIGMTYRTEDLPWVNRMTVRPDGTRTCRALVPDVIVNPHCIPSRMTIGKLLEALLGKAACMEGEIGDGTPYGGVHAEDIDAVLLKHGFQPGGKEIMYHPHTGEPIEADIFFAPCYYQSLRHVAIDKIHARSRGPVQILTQQPMEGRSRDGGLRLGEMERDCMIAHGAAQFTKDRLYEQSDAYSTVVCTKCHLLAEPPRPAPPGGIDPLYRLRSNDAYCRLCKTGEHVREFKLSYAFKLLYQELMACSIGVRFHLS